MVVVCYICISLVTLLIVRVSIWYIAADIGVSLARACFEAFVDSVKDL